MPLLPNVILRVKQPNGEFALYEIARNVLANLGPGVDYNQKVLEHGSQIAYERDNFWYWADSRERIIDGHTLTLIDRCADAVDPYMGAA